MLTNITQLMEHQRVIDQLLSKARSEESGSGGGNSTEVESLTAAKVVLEETVEHICPWVSCSNYNLLLNYLKFTPPFILLAAANYS